MDSEGVLVEYLARRCSGVAASVGALVDLMEVGHIEAEVSMARCREALSGARNRKLREDQP